MGGTVGEQYSLDLRLALRDHRAQSGLGHWLPAFESSLSLVPE